eukprot:11226883-Alexandrium_andersonii.AAC.1
MSFSSTSASPSSACRPSGCSPSFAGAASRRGSFGWPCPSFGAGRLRSSSQVGNGPRGLSMQ